MKEKFFFVVVVLVCFLVCGCKEKTYDVGFLFEAEFSEKFLVQMIDDASKEAAQTEQNPFPETKGTFYGLTPDEVGEIIKRLGDCKTNFDAVFSADIKGFSISRVFLKKGSKFNCDFLCANGFPEKVFSTYEVMKKEFPEMIINFGDDKKSFVAACTFARDYVMFEGKDGKGIELSEFSKAEKTDGVNVKIHGKKVFITIKDENVGVLIKITLDFGI